MGFLLEKQRQCFKSTAVLLCAHTARGLSHRGRYTLLSGLRKEGFFCYKILIETILIDTHCMLINEYNMYTIAM
jgi:hypothetical protein